MGLYGYPNRDVGQLFTDASVTLSAGQASGSAPVLAANPNRTGIAITPNADGRVYFTGTASADGPYFQLYAGVTFMRVGGECPTGDIYVTGQGATGAKLRMGEA